MQLKVTTWNIKSVRLRIELVAKFIKSVRPDVICLQEIKCPDDAFPLKSFNVSVTSMSCLTGRRVITASA